MDVRRVTDPVTNLCRATEPAHLGPSSMRILLWRVVRQVSMPWQIEIRSRNAIEPKGAPLLSSTREQTEH